MKPMNIKNVLSIGLLLSVFPTFSMITDGSELGRGLLADQETELPHISDHVAITIDGASSSTETSPAKSTDGLMSGERSSIWHPVTNLPTKVKNWWDSLDDKQKGRYKALPYIIAAIGNEFYALYVQSEFYPLPIAMTCAYEISGYLALDKLKWKVLGSALVGCPLSFLQSTHLVNAPLYPIVTAGLVALKSIRDTLPDHYSDLSAAEKDSLQAMGIGQLDFNKMSPAGQISNLKDIRLKFMEEGKTF